VCNNEVVSALFARAGLRRVSSKSLNLLAPRVSAQGAQGPIEASEIIGLLLRRVMRAVSPILRIGGRLWRAPRIRREKADG
jgi:hypothetical protein